MMPNPYQQYQRTQVQTASTGELVVLLYDGAVRFLTRAQFALGAGRMESAAADLVRAQEIVLELMTGLNFEDGGTLAVHLRDLYLFMYDTLVQANIKKDTARIQTVIDLLDEVRTAWRIVVSSPPPTQPAAMPVGGRAA
jgi:flagellar secretion chaperone FliS